MNDGVDVMLTSLFSSGQVTHLDGQVNSFGRRVDLCGLLLKLSKWTIWPNSLNLQGGLKVSNHLLAEWSRVDFLLYPYCH